MEVQKGGQAMQTSTSPLSGQARLAPLRLAGLTLLLALAALLLAACGGGGPEPSPEGGGHEVTETPTGAGATATPSEAGVVATPTVPPPVTVAVNKSFWHGGWKVTLGEATFAPSSGGFGLPEASVSIEATFENLGGDDAAFNSHLVLAAGGQNYTQTTSDQEIPEVPGKLSQAGKITFAVDPEFGFDDAVLIVGRPENQQAHVPLGPRGGDFVSLEPRELQISGELTTPAATMTVSGGELRADIPEDYDEAKAGRLALFIRWSVIGADDCFRQSVGPENLALKLPDGTAVGAEFFDAVIDIITDPGVTFERTTYFLVKDPPQGSYALVLRGLYSCKAAAAPAVEAEMPFQIP
jgi:hypothetical protein